MLKTIWAEDDKRLVHCRVFGSNTIYLFVDSIPITSRYMSRIEETFNLPSDKIIEYTLDHRIDEKIRKFVDVLEQRRYDYRKTMPYFEERLKLNEKDAEILALHFSSMGLEAIALLLDIPLKDVRESFDRIMKAYIDAGIVVNDKVFTEDPISLY